MRSVAIIAFAVLVASCAAKRPQHPHEVAAYTFEQYAKDFDKPYKTKQGTLEFETRRAIFEEKKKRVLAHNNDEQASRLYKKGINQFTDRTETEFRKRLGGKIRGKWAEREELRSSAFSHQYKLTGAPVPNSVDWRNRVPSIFTGIKDQGDCGSCWAHAATENLESHWALQTGELFTLSQQEVTSCAPNPNSCGGTGGCEGSIAELAYKYLATAGVTQEWEYPYTSYHGVTGTCQPDHQKTDVNITGYTAIAPNDQAAVMEAIATVGPLAVNVDASGWSEYAGGIFDGCNYKNNVTIDHVVQLVGYGHDAGLGQDYWIVRNSWSPAFGENGYIRLIRTKTPSCGWDVDPQQGTACKGSPNQLYACGQCGILFDTLYPNVVA